METHLHSSRHDLNDSYVLGPGTTSFHELTSVTTAAFRTLLTTTLGPHAARQYMRFNNQTVVDKVPEDMLHLIDSHWYIFNFDYFSYIVACPKKLNVFVFDVLPA